MRLLLSVMPFALISSINSANSADCFVLGDAVTCAPGDDYVPANHGGKKINEYATVNLHRTAANKHGYAQYSNQLVYKDVFIVVEGLQGDGYTLRNFGPTAEFNNLTITASGLSGDGINVGRDNSGGKLTVHQTAIIESKQGMGIRSVSSDQDAQKHIITFKGSSAITTYADGSNDAGHAVYAGTQINGCRILWDCKALSLGEIYLLGNQSDLHTITTAGNEAYGLYANGRGRIFAENIDVRTDGQEAHGLVAGRRSARYNASWTDIKNQDYAGSIELRGNVGVVVNGSNSYAFLVDSYDGTNGADTQGNIATIRSYNSETNTIVEDKVYKVKGNMLAKNAGIINLWVGDRSNFWGTTQTANNGILKLNIAGANSVWHLKEDATFTDLTLRDKAVLSLAENAVSTDHYIVNGQFINNSGIVKLSANALVGDQLTINGDYTSDDGLLQLNTALGLDSSVTDMIHITGITTGTGVIQVFNVGGNGAQTIDGIKIVEIEGNSGALFTLAGDYEHEGAQAVVAGAYAYKLHKGRSGGADGDWYLRSQLKDDPKPPIIDPLYNAGAPIYEAYPQFLLGLNGLPTMQQRVGNRSWKNAGSKQGADLVETFASTTETGSFTQTNGVWGRIEGSHNKSEPRFSTSASTYDFNSFKMQAGLDGQLTESENGKLIGGLTAHYTHGKANIASIHGDGDIKTDGYGFGGALSWYGDNGFYVDGQGQLTWFRSELNTSTGKKDLADGKNNGFGYALSVEAGQRIAIDDQWSVTPQAQLQYSNVDFDDFTTKWGKGGRSDVSRDKGDSLIGRLGASLDYQDSWQNAQGMTDRSVVYGIVNFYNEFLDGTKVDVNRTSFTNKSERFWGGVGFGGSYNWNDDKYSIYGEGSVTTSFRSFGDSYSYKGTVGLRIKW